MSGEPLIIIGAVDAAIIAGQQVIVGMPSWAHAVSAAVVAGLGFILGRSQVTPAL